MSRISTLANLSQPLNACQSQGANRKSTYRQLLDTCLLWDQRIRQRRDLRELADSPELMKDIGISRYDVLREGRKPFWRA